jgi:hypothetical protein
MTGRVVQRNWFIVGLGHQGLGFVVDDKGTNRGFAQSGSLLSKLQSTRHPIGVPRLILFIQHRALLAGLTA